MCLLQRSQPDRRAAGFSQAPGSHPVYAGDTKGSPWVYCESWKQTTAWLELKQIGERLTHLCKKLDQVMLRGSLAQTLGMGTAPEECQLPPVITEEFFAAFKPADMYSRLLFNEPSLAHLLLPDPKTLTINRRPILLLATFELLCRELDFHPEPDFLVQPVNLS